MRILPRRLLAKCKIRPSASYGSFHSRCRVMDSLMFLGYDPGAIRRLWIEVTNIISRSSGVISVLTHCERSFSGNSATLGTYLAFIGRSAGDRRFRFVKPRGLIF